jgi:hypothetical protein
MKVRRERVQMQARRALGGQEVITPSDFGELSRVAADTCPEGGSPQTVCRRAERRDSLL